MTFIIMDKDSVGNDDEVGRYSIPVESLASGDFFIQSFFIFSQNQFYQMSVKILNCDSYLKNV